MPVVIKNSDGLNMLKQLGLPADDIAWVEKSQIHIVTGTSGISFGSFDGTHVVGVPCKYTHLAQLQEGKLGTLAKTSLQMVVAAGLKKLKTQIAGADVEADASPVGFGADHTDGFGGTFKANKLVSPSPEGHHLSTSYMSSLQMLKKNTEKAKADFKKEMEAEYKKELWPGEVKAPTSQPVVVNTVAVGNDKWPAYDVASMTSGERVKLCDANMMYQPVHGSDADSRYYVVGGNNELRIGARYRNGRLSIRVEGPQWKSYVGYFKTIGFNTVNPGGQYASIHWDVDSDLKAQKALGAILLGLGVAWESPVPNLMVIKGK